MRDIVQKDIDILFEIWCLSFIYYNRRLI
jgi:hypothetical protein